MKTVEKQLMVNILKSRGWVTVRTRIGVKPVSEAPEYQIRGLYLSGKHYRPIKREAVLNYSI